jgi:hypothetical protein
MSSMQKKIFVIKKVKKVKKWSIQEDEILMTQTKGGSVKEWRNIKNKLPGRDAYQCYARYCRLKVKWRSGKWGRKEDRKLLSLVNTHGNKWSVLAKIMKTRSPKQIRDRYLNFLDPTIDKSKFEESEDRKIIELYLRYGSAWSKISRHFTGRTDGAIKNRFYSCLFKQVHKEQYLLKQTTMNLNLIRKNTELISENSKEIAEEKTLASIEVPQSPTSNDNLDLMPNFNYEKTKNELFGLHLHILNSFQQLDYHTAAFSTYYNQLLLQSQYVFTK